MGMTATITPMMAQYLDIKARHADALLFYRMGDFYEMFFDDAVAAAEALDIALTRRGKHEGDDIPMCGVPAHSADGYLLTLIRKGFRVAICEQLEDPAEAKKRGSKAVVKRDVVRVVTPGTLTEDTLLDARRHNFLAGIAQVRDATALAWCDISTGDFSVQPLPAHRLGAELARLCPGEVLIPETGLEMVEGILSDLGVPATRLPNGQFDSRSAEPALCDAFGVASLDGFGNFERAELAAMGAVVRYLEVTQKGSLPLLRPPVRVSMATAMALDPATRRNLELTEALGGGRANTLLASIDRTLTAPGARLMERRMSSPATDASIITDRHDKVAALVDRPDLRRALRDILRHVPDLDRALSRLALDRGGPRDLGAVRDGLHHATDLRAALDRQGDDALAGIAAALDGPGDLSDLLGRALADDLPVTLRDGGMVAKGHSPDLDATRKLRDEGRGVIAGLQAQYVEATGIGALKIKHNNVLGYFIETPATHAERMLGQPLADTFIHRQTTANALRFTTLDLSELEKRILNAADRARALEREIFETLRAAVLAEAGPLATLTRAIAELDLAAGLAERAAEGDWVRPEITTGRDLMIEGGRHPVVEAALRASGATFVPNDAELSATEDSAHILLLTGPNMAGKSTYLRQIALIVILAQMGSFVPATKACIGIVSQVFSRVGAADDLARGRSTFMVEMVETAAILNQADATALVILDEIGRGTATYDGLSIAWATVEHLHAVNRCRAIFATHYHEMTALAGQLENVRNATVAVKEFKGEIVFLHQVRDGAADRSYGVQVAKLAGLPAPVIARAQEVLHKLETRETAAGGETGLLDDLPLFSTHAPTPPEPAPDSLRKTLDEVNPDDLTARQALEMLYRLKDIAAGD
jgi:DNA mismatch repair protein MutS